MKRDFGKASKRNVRRHRKARVKEPEPLPISASQAADYLGILERIRSGVRSPSSSPSKSERSPADAAHIAKLRKDIAALNIADVIHIDTSAQLPDAHVL